MFGRKASHSCCEGLKRVFSTCPRLILGTQYAKGVEQLYSDLIKRFAFSTFYLA